MLLLCPFHEDSNPSLQVYPEPKRFVCFSCGRSGTFAELKVKLVERITAEVGELISKAQYSDGYATVLTQDMEALEFVRQQLLALQEQGT